MDTPLLFPKSQQIALPSSTFSVLDPTCVTSRSVQWCLSAGLYVCVSVKVLASVCVSVKVLASVCVSVEVLAVVRHRATHRPHSGIVLALPFDLTLPFARHIAHNNIQHVRAHTLFLLCGAHILSRLTSPHS